MSPRPRPAPVQGLARSIVVVGCENICSAVGVQDNTVIPDNSMSSNNYHDHSWHKPWTGRLRSFIGWIPNEGKDNIPGLYLQVDLGAVFLVCAVATQGGNDHRGIQRWTTKYKISTSIDDSKWTLYPNNKSSKVRRY